MKKFLLTILCTAAVALPVAAEEWRLDTNHSKLKFPIEARVTGAEGLFHTYTVKDDIDEKNLEKSKFEVTVDMTSLDTNSEPRDKHLKTPDFFDVAQFPTAKIAVNSIKKLSDTTFEGEGTITLHGVTKSAKFPVRILLNEGGILRFRGQVEINRKEYGVSYDKGPNKIEDVATVTYEFNLRKPGQGKGGPPPAPKSNN